MAITFGHHLPWTSGVSTVLRIQQPRLVLTRAVLRHTHPASVCFCLANTGQAAAGVLDCLVELKRGLIGHPHSLPRQGWGYPAQVDLAVGVTLVEAAQLWTVVEQLPSGRPLDARLLAQSESDWRLMFAGIVTYRSGSRSVYQTGFHRRLDCNTGEFAIQDSGDAELEYAGRRLS
jgi:hypothetical protein